MSESQCKTEGTFGAFGLSSALADKKVRGAWAGARTGRVVVALGDGRELGQEVVPRRRKILVLGLILRDITVRTNIAGILRRMQPR